MAGDVKALLGQARLPERTVEICLRGDIVAQIEDLDRQLNAQAAAPTVDDTRLNSRPAQSELAEQIEALREQMRDSTAVFRLRALTRRQWDALIKEHPPRTTEDSDKALGFNPETFFDALVQRSVINPTLSPAEWEQLFDAITSNQFDQLAGAALALNRYSVDVPFSSAASRILNSARK